MNRVNRLERFSRWIRPGLVDFGTVWLGAAAIFLTRAVPTSSFQDFDPGMMAVCVGCLVVGIVLRAAFRV